MNIFNRDFGHKQPQKTPVKEIIAASIITLTLSVLAVLVIVALPEAIDHALGIGK